MTKQDIEKAIEMARKQMRGLRVKGFFKKLNEQDKVWLRYLKTLIRLKREMLKGVE
mgnify:CR=1 FL=1